VTVEFAIELDGLCWEVPTVLCLRPVTSVFELQIHWAEGQLHLVCVKSYTYFV